MRIILSIILLVSLSQISNSQELKRRAYLGVYGTEITDSVAGIYNINSGINIDSFTNISLTEKHKLKPADIILSINGNVVSTMRSLKQQVSLSREGDKVSFKIIRKGRVKEITGIYPVFPYEESETHEIIYDKFEFDDRFIRVIIDKPNVDKPQPNRDFSHL